MRKFILLLCASVMMGQDVITPVPLELQVEFFKAHVNLIKAQNEENKILTAMITFCGALHQDTVQNNKTEEFGCQTPAPEPSDPSFDLASR